jgi:hypothetical protein
MLSHEPVDVPKGAEVTIEQGRALVRAIEALQIIEPSPWFEDRMARLLLGATGAAYARVPAWMGQRILEVAEGLPDFRGVPAGRPNRGH